MKSIKSPMAGTVWKIVKAVGDTVDYGDTVAILESMKMEIPVEADSAGTITRIVAAEGDVVDDGAVLVELS
ncbi:MAG: acetyl-CoA carboxylase biotin carboxyl carrier protein subunit [Stagnimonas sp.]|jgi:acetyl-CoA carboxylase biotin carboxyl carrier protein|nr:acetyl-CoA carboxylase biotin carboxyl carrier protein subunit [Stagnimonas sp.]